jgi:hypothetical protein
VTIPPFETVPKRASHAGGKPEPGREHVGDLTVCRHALSSNAVATCHGITGDGLDVSLRTRMTHQRGQVRYLFVGGAVCDGGKACAQVIVVAADDLDELVSVGGAADEAEERCVVRVGQVTGRKTDRAPETEREQTSAKSLRHRLSHAEVSRERKRAQDFS